MPDSCGSSLRKFGHNRCSGRNSASTYMWSPPMPWYRRPPVGRSACPVPSRVASLGGEQGGVKFPSPAASVPLGLAPVDRRATTRHSNPRSLPGIPPAVCGGILAHIAPCCSSTALKVSRLLEAQPPWFSCSVRAVPGFENSGFVYGVGTLFRRLAHGEHPNPNFLRMHP